MNARAQTKQQPWYRSQVIIIYFYLYKMVKNVILTHFSNNFWIGLCTTQKEIKSKVILAGDPKQLDAVCKSSVAAELGFKVSLMERLFNKPLYSRDYTNKYNPKYITQLVKNYRSHEAILHTPSVRFYGGTLEAEAPEGMIVFVLLHSHQDFN